MDWFLYDGVLRRERVNFRKTNCKSRNPYILFQKLKRNYSWLQIFWKIWNNVFKNSDVRKKWWVVWRWVLFIAVPIITCYYLQSTLIFNNWYLGIVNNNSFLFYTNANGYLVNVNIKLYSQGEWTCSASALCSPARIMTSNALYADFEPRLLLSFFFSFSLLYLLCCSGFCFNSKA